MTDTKLSDRAYYLACRITNREHPFESDVVCIEKVLAAVEAETAEVCCEMLDGWGEVCRQRKDAIHARFSLKPADGEG